MLGNLGSSPFLFVERGPCLGELSKDEWIDNLCLEECVSSSRYKSANDPYHVNQISDEPGVKYPWDAIKPTVIKRIRRFNEGLWPSFQRESNIQTDR